MHDELTDGGTIYHTPKGDVFVPPVSSEEQPPNYPPEWIVSKEHILHTTYIEHINYNTLNNCIEIRYRSGGYVNIPDPHNTVWKAIQEVLARGG